jgi:uncharacterized membrane protein YdfJ with MMPL/SSD domain
MTTKQQRPGIAARAGRWSANHRALAIFGWIAFVVVAAMVGSNVGMNKIKDADTGSGASKKADQAIEHAFPKDPAGEIILIQAKGGANTSAEFTAVAKDVRAKLAATRNVQNIERVKLSHDGRSGIVDFELKGDPDKAEDTVDDALATTAALQRAHPEFRVEEFGSGSAGKALSKRFDQDFKKSEASSIPLTLIILLAAFGSLLAALVPVLLGVSAVFAALGLTAVVSQVIPVDEAVANVVLLVGLAVGVDYTMFYLRREREERSHGVGHREAIAIAATTSGRAVLVSGFTVMIAMAGMFLTGDPTFTSFAVGTILVVAVAMLGSLTVLPALLATFPRAMDFPKRFSRRRPESRFWNAILRPVLRRPMAAMLASAGLLIVLALPAFKLHLVEAGIQGLPRDLPVMQTYDRIQAAFPGDAIPATVVVEADDVTSPAVQTGIADMRREALASGRLQDPVKVTVSKDHHVAMIDIPVQGTGTDDKSDAALKVLRDDVIPATVAKSDGVKAANVTGVTAGSKDFNDLMKSHVPYVFAFVLSAAFLLLLVTFRSIVIPIKAIVLNLLSVGAAYGVLVAVFQWGWGESILGFRSIDGITSWLPLFMFVILFGLSMDYHVFILSRIREAFDRGMSTKDAVAHGVKTTASVVTSAAVVMVGVFGIFATLAILDFKMMGVGLATAILIDATIVRAVLLPATMTLLGDWNWYLPKWLEWLPRVTHEPPVESLSTRPVRKPEREPEPVGV